LPGRFLLAYPIAFLQQVGESYTAMQASKDSRQDPEGNV